LISSDCHTVVDDAVAMRLPIRQKSTARRLDPRDPSLRRLADLPAHVF
jgi:hypothetical protein